MGRLVRHKGVHYLIEAFKKINQSRGLKLVIVGDGFYTDDYVRQIKNAAGIQSNIIFTGNLEGDELKEIFANAYLFVQPSETEGLSISLLEAMGYGIPVLVSDIKENTDVVGAMGFTFKSGNVDSLKNQLEKIVNDGEDFRQKIECASAEIESKYNWAKIAGQTEAVSEDAMKKREIVNSGIQAKNLN